MNDENARHQLSSMDWNVSMMVFIFVINMILWTDYHHSQLIFVTQLYDLNSESNAANQFARVLFAERLVFDRKSLKMGSTHIGLCFVCFANVRRFENRCEYSWILMIWIEKRNLPLIFFTTKTFSRMADKTWFVWWFQTDKGHLYSCLWWSFS